MNNKMQRLRIITALLIAQVIDSQEQLLRALRSQGIDVTQATLSRDLRDLRAEKKVLPDGKQKYIIPNNPIIETRLLGMESDIAKRSIQSVNFSGNLAVVKTRPGYANAVAYDIDERGGAYILGTIAGDDTILVIPKDDVSRKQLCEFLLDKKD